MDVSSISCVVQLDGTASESTSLSSGQSPAVHLVLLFPTRFRPTLNVYFASRSSSRIARSHTYFTSDQRPFKVLSVFPLRSISGKCKPPYPGSRIQPAFIHGRTFLIRTPCVQSLFFITNSVTGREEYPPRRSNPQWRGREATKSNKTVYKTSVSIHDAHTYEYSTLINFHSALLFSILARYRSGLQKIDITLWAFTVPVAKAISDLSALRSFSVKIQEPYYVRSLPKDRKLAQLAAWQLLATCTAWARRLLVLKIENTDITENCLFQILENNTCCQELSLRRCAYISRTLWSFFATKWRGRDVLKTLVIEEYGGMLDNTTLEAIINLGALQVSSPGPSSSILHRRRLIGRCSFSIFAAVLE
jgi:hypothetical protein